jgi:hypothetical protein
MSKIELGAETVDPLQPDAPVEVDIPRFVIGHGRRGGWIVNDRLGLVGGIFVSEAAARHFAFEESGGDTGNRSLWPRRRHPSI